MGGSQRPLEIRAEGGGMKIEIQQASAMNSPSTLATPPGGRGIDHTADVGGGATPSVYLHQNETHRFKCKIGSLEKPHSSKQAPADGYQGCQRNPRAKTRAKTEGANAILVLCARTKIDLYRPLRRGVCLYIYGEK